MKDMVNVVVGKKSRYDREFGRTSNAVFVKDFPKTRFATPMIEKMINKAWTNAGGLTTDYTEQVPTLTADFFIERVKWKNRFRQILRTIDMPSATFKIPRMTAGDKAYLQAEGYDIRTESGADQASSGYVKPTFDEVTLTAKKFAAITGWTLELEEDSVLQVAEYMVQELADGLAEYEELAIMQGDAAGSVTGTVGGGYPNMPGTTNIGDVRRAFNGVLMNVPNNSGATASGWTPASTSTSVNVIDGGGDALTYDEINNLFAVIEDAGFELTDIFVTPKVAARLRDDVEFEMFLTVDKIGDRASVIRGQVGEIFGAAVHSAKVVPVGTAFGSAQGYTLVVGIDRSELVIGDRRMVSIKSNEEFYRDAREVKITERIAFAPFHDEGIAIIERVTNATK